jgi:hypothetical protein
MFAKFRYLDNLGTPTSWDVTRFEIYRDRVMPTMSSDLQSLASNSRYELDSDSTFWFSKLESFQYAGSTASFQSINRWGTKRFYFKYEGVKRITLPSQKFYFPILFTVQELTVLRNSLKKHVWSDTAGSEFEIICLKMCFLEDEV